MSKYNCVDCGEPIPWRTTAPDGTVSSLSPSTRKRCLVCLPYTTARRRNEGRGFKICRKCGETFKTRVIIDGRLRDLWVRRYCLVCSPFGGGNTRQLEFVRTDGLKECTTCGEEKPREDFARRRHKNGVERIVMDGSCRACNAAQLRTAKRRLKLAAIAYKGGKCEDCGYDEYADGLSFHHADPAAKDFEISRVVIRRFTGIDTIKAELDKCRLLCLVCHAEAHARAHGSPPLAAEQRQLAEEARK